VTLPPPRPSRRRPDDLILYAGTGACALLIILLVCAIGVTLYLDSRLAREKFGLGFWSGRRWDPVSGEFGALPFIWGTVYSSLLALLVATPVALGIAIFLSDLCPRRLRGPLVYMTELLAAIPSIVYGLWGLYAIVPLVRKTQLMLPDWLRSLPFFSGPPVGVSMAAAVLILAVMIVPFTASVAREVLKAVPVAQREAAYALGATRWEAIRMTLGWGRTGLIGAVMLGLSRALGETMAVTMVIGNSPLVVLSIFKPQYTMAAVIANEFTEATGDLYLHALVEIGLVLFAITILINTFSRLLIWSVDPGSPVRAWRRERVAATPSASAA
jgi:phosphate transport system permease protein